MFSAFFYLFKFFQLKLEINSSFVKARNFQLYIYIIREIFSHVRVFRRYFAKFYFSLNAK